jgi:glycosidase
LDRVKPEVILLSESDRPDDQLKAFDINYNFEYYFTLRSVLRDGAPAIRLRENWEQMHATMPQGARLLRYSDNHDWPRAVLQFGERGALAASVLNFTLDGVPFLYNGQEVNDPSPTSWRRLAPIHWPKLENKDAGDSPGAVFATYKRLFHLRSSEPAISSGSVVWVNNSEPDSVLSFLRERQDSEVLVMVNLSNRNVHVTMDLPVMNYYVLDNLLEPGKIWFQLYSGRVSVDLGAFGYVVGRNIPLAPLPQ